MTPDLPNPPVPADAWKPAGMTITDKLAQALRYYRDECSGAEPSLSVFEDLLDQALAEYDSAPSAPVVDAAAERCQPDGLKFDAFGEPRTRYVRVSLENDHCVMHPSEGDSYLKNAREWGDESPYVVRDVWLSEREFDDLPEHNGF